MRDFSFFAIFSSLADSFPPAWAHKTTCSCYCIDLRFQIDGKFARTRNPDSAMIRGCCWDKALLRPNINNMFDADVRGLDLVANFGWVDRQRGKSSLWIEVKSCAIETPWNHRYPRSFIKCTNSTIYLSVFSFICTICFFVCKISWSVRRRSNRRRWRGEVNEKRIVERLFPSQ